MRCFPSAVLPIGDARRLLRRSGLMLGLVLGVVLGGPSGSAFAAVAALERAGALTGFSSANKSVTASCPAGKRVLGTGADIGSGNGEVVMAGLIPDAALTSVSVRGLEYGNGSAGSWSLGVSALCATPVPGLERVVAASPTNSSNKGVSASCPAGKRLLGTGAEIKGAGGQVELDELIPNAALTSVSAVGAEDENGTAANWSVTAYAICASPVAGLVRVVATSASNSSDGKSAVAICPAGKQVTGVGGALTGGGGQVVMDDLIPFPDPATSVQVVGREDDNGTTANWRAAAYAICANSSQRVVATSATGSEAKLVFADCPAGKQLTGVGGDITGGLGQVLMDDLSPIGSPPTDVRVEAYEDGNGTSASWTVRAYAICATPLPGLEPVAVSSPFNDSSAVKNVVAPCPSGKRLVGTGGEITGGDGQVVLDQLVPNAALTSVTVRAQEDGDGTDANWSVAAYAICANPPPGLQLTSAMSEIDSEELKVVGASCPTGKNLLGTGGAIVNAGGQVVLDDLRPDAGLKNVTVTGIEDDTGLAFDWSAEAYAICANP